MNEDRIKLLGETPVKKALLTLALPSIIGMLINAIYNLADTYFIGQLNNEAAMAAIAVAFPLLMLVGTIGGMFGIGGGSYLSRLLGEEKYEESNHTTSISFFTCLAVGVIVTILIIIYLNPILKSFGATESILPYAYKYSLILTIGNVITMLNMTMNNLLRSEGAAKQSMISFLLGTGLNIVLDPIFIFTFGMGVEGAAWATMIGKIVSFIYLIYFYMSGKSIAKISIKYFKPTKVIYKEIFKIGIPSFVRQGLGSISMAITNSVAMQYGDAVIAGLGVSMRVFSISFFILFGLSTGFQPIAGYSYGAKNFNRLKESIKTTMIWGTGICLFFTVVFLLGSDIILRFFSPVESVVTFGVQIMNAMMIFLPFLGFQITATTLFQSIGRGKPALILSLTRQGIFLLPALYILPKLYGFKGLIYSQPTADFFTIILTLIFYISIRKQIFGNDISSTYNANKLRN